ncbi:MAG: sugar transferase [Deltaproteobacteria bacterium CG07_land_8_20_14_0_80_38_7]|nr:MAG: sugar transferase [Deltaproteobacteria bacterium CG07_land_8_20_14_0_80_38_7]
MSNINKLKIKRIIDVVISLVLLIFLLPLFVVITIFVKITSRGPVFYKWRVLGKDAKPFIGYKFRTMIESADNLKEKLRHLNEMKGPVFKIKNDPRITKLGKFLRKYSLDELPQLWSVLKGDMSLVGPRPPSAEEYADFENWQKRKLSATPGITCLWQVSGRNEINNFSEWVKLDLYYIDHWSLGLDIKILLKTLFAVVSAKGAS